MLALCLTAIFAPPQAATRLGDSKEALIDRFGAPTAKTPGRVLAREAGTVVPIGERLCFRSDIWQVEAVIANGRCIRINYRKPGEWTEDQFTSLLTSNAGGLTWRETTKSKLKIARTWKRDDAATAEWVATKGMEFTASEFEPHKLATIETAKKKTAAPPSS